MKTAQEIKPGQVIMIDGSPWKVQKNEFNRAGRSSAINKM
jgi:elongation factor P